MRQYTYHAYRQRSDDRDQPGQEFYSVRRYGGYPEMIILAQNLTKAQAELFVWALSAIADNMSLQAWPNMPWLPSAPNRRDYTGPTDGIAFPATLDALT